ncbi:MAG: AAA family ATPase [Oscillospiraceae bacterium]|nr:AAA family ATPase [Oscillospiraceae bacterium]
MKKDYRYTAISIYLNKIKNDPESNPFDSPELAVGVAEKLLQSVYSGNFTEVISDCEKIYKEMLPLPEAENASVVREVFLRLLDKDGIYFNGLYSVQLYGCFGDPVFYLQTMQSLLKIKGIKKHFNLTVSCALEARAFFIDERQFGAWLIYAASRLAMAEGANSAEFVKNELLTDVRRSSGIYDVSEAGIAAACENVRTVKKMLEEVKGDIEALTRRTESFAKLAEDCERDVKERALGEAAKLRQETSECSIKIKKAYEEILEGERRSLQFDRDKLLREIFDSADSKIRELKMVAESIRSTTAGELYRINTEASRAAERAAAMLQSGELKEIMEDLRKNEDLVEKIVRVENFSRQFDEEKTEGNVAVVNRVIPGTIPQQMIGAAQVQPVVGTPVYENRPAEIYGKQPDESVNFYFNEAIPFEERMAQLSQRKHDLESEGEIFHLRFDDILVAVIEDSNPYLIGPSGCGKTYLIGQIADMLGLECLDVGYINEEYDLIGFQTASGGYNYPAFYRAYKFGGIVFCDEFDNSNSRAAVKLNSFMSGGKEASYCFPNGERVKRHPNFRIIAAGNTAGSGADRNYSTREKIEESVAQRFTAMYVNYDNRLEGRILEKYPEWFGFACAFRRATDDYRRTNDILSPGIFTTRDAASIKKYLDHNSFDDKSIMEYEFIETKETDHLAFLKNSMEKFYSENGEAAGRGLFEIFAARVDTLIENGGIR